MVGAAASARANLIESKQQINILECHTKRLSQERDSANGQASLLKDRLNQLQHDFDRQRDELLREKTLRQSELAKLKIDKLEQNIESVENECVNGSKTFPDEIPQIHENDIAPKCGDLDDEEQDDIDKLTLRIES